MEKSMLSKHFSLEEFVHSNLATAKGLDNTPSLPFLENLRYLAQVLERIRHDVLLDQPLHISSGYRSTALNKAVGGVLHSAHLKGLAADFICPGFGTPQQVCMAIAQSSVDFDQVIFEFGRWVHLGLAQPGTTSRREVLSVDKKGPRRSLLKRNQ